MPQHLVRPVRSFVLRSGRMTDSQKLAYEQLKEKHAIKFAQGEKIDTQKLFGNNNPLVIEIGFGMGFATIEIAKANPNINYIGIEVHKPGVGKVLSEIEANNLKNLKVIEHDAIEVIDHGIEDGTISSFHIFFPDPWPKKRHHKRRLIQDDFSALLSRKLKKDGSLYYVSDWEEYAREVLGIFTNTCGIVNAFTEFAPHQEWRPITKFEKKGFKENRQSWEVLFKKV